MSTRPRHPLGPSLETSPSPSGVVSAPPPLAAEGDRLTLRLEELARAFGVSRRAIERERSAGRFPKPDLTIGRMPLWKPETIREWIGKGGRP